MTVLFDVETDGLWPNYTKIHCIAVKSADDKEPLLFTNMEHFAQWARRHQYEYWVAHNGCSFDWWVVNELTDFTIPKGAMLDTSVLSKLKNYNKYQTHSLKEIGESLGVYKGDYEGGWNNYTSEMGRYCVQDVKVLEAIFSSVKDVLDQEEAVRVEHQMSFICEEMHRTGFKFNKTKALDLLDDVEEEMEELEESMHKQWPAQLVEDRRIKRRYNKDGTPNKSMSKAMDAAPKWRIEGDEVVLYRWKDFNPGSPQDRIDKLWDAGWKPYDRTKGHIQHLREKKGKGYGRK